MSTRRATIFRVLLLVVALLAACADAPGDPQAGKRLFDGEIALADRAALPCRECHALGPGGAAGPGPSLAGIADRASATVPGQTADVYLRTSIVDPDAYLAGGYQDGLMYRGYGRALTARQINDLVAYMLTLKGG